MLQLLTVAPVPADTMRVAKDAIPEGNTCMALRDRLGAIFDDALFAPLFQSGTLDSECTGRDANVEGIWRGPLERRRCLVPADGYYEWKKLDARNKQPYAFARTDGRMMAFAGL